MAKKLFEMKPIFFFAQSKWNEVKFIDCAVDRQRQLQAKGLTPRVLRQRFRSPSSLTSQQNGVLDSTAEQQVGEPLTSHGKWVTINYIECQADTASISFISFTSLIDVFSCLTRRRRLLFFARLRRVSLIGAHNANDELQIALNRK